MACSARRSIPDKPSSGDGNSSSSRRSAGPRKGSCGTPRLASAASSEGSGRRSASHADAAAASVSSEAVTRDGHRVSSSSAVSSPSPRNDRLPGNEPTTIISGTPFAEEASARTSRSWSWSYRSCSNHKTTRCRSTPTSQPGGLDGTPSAGHFVRASAHASCTASSAVSRSPVSRVTTATACHQQSRNSSPYWSLSSAPGRTAGPPPCRRTRSAAARPT